MGADMKDFSALWQTIRQSRIFAAWQALRWVIALSSAAFTMAYIGYKEHSTISEDVSFDFAVVAEEQTELLDNLTTLLPSLLDPKVQVSLSEEMERTRVLAQSVANSLGQFRAPTRRIDRARNEYRSALEELIGVTRRIERDGSQDIALLLHNSVQLAANNAGDFLNAVQDFQGGAIPNVFGALF